MTPTVHVRYPPLCTMHPVYTMVPHVRCVHDVRYVSSVHRLLYAPNASKVPKVTMCRISVRRYVTYAPYVAYVACVACVPYEVYAA